MFQMASADEAERLISFLAACGDIFCWEDGVSICVELHDRSGPWDIASRHYAALFDEKIDSWVVHTRAASPDPVCTVERTLDDDDEEVVLKLLDLERRHTPQEADA